MGTRADFYVGVRDMEWLGSIAWDGYPSGIDIDILGADHPEDYRAAVKAFIESRDDGTFPEMGWPWPWEDSNTTDFAYTWYEGGVYGSSFGSPWHPVKDGIWKEEWNDIEGPKPEFPNMEHIKNVTFGKRSGVLILGATDERD